MSRWPARLCRFRRSTPSTLFVAQDIQEYGVRSGSNWRKGCIIFGAATFSTAPRSVPAPDAEVLRLAQNLAGRR